MLNWRELKMIDIANPEQSVEVKIVRASLDNATLWVNVDGICQLRVTHIKDGIFSPIKEP